MCIRDRPITIQRLSKTLLPATAPEQARLFDLPEKKAPIKVLAVDDNEANLKLINELLLEQVHEVTTATDGAQAVELCKHEKFALIFMDIQMPVLDGISALSIIRQQTLNEHTPIIAVTAHVFGEEKDKLLGKGFNAFITKPIDEAMLHHSIYEYCDSSLLANDLSLIHISEPTRPY